MSYVKLFAICFVGTGLLTYGILTLNGTSARAQNRWSVIGSTQDDAFICVDEKPNAQLAVIYDRNFQLVEVRCYPEGGVN